MKKFAIILTSALLAGLFAYGQQQDMRRATGGSGGSSSNYNTASFNTLNVTNTGYFNNIVVSNGILGGVSNFVTIGTGSINNTNTIYANNLVSTNDASFAGTLEVGGIVTMTNLSTSTRPVYSIGQSLASAALNTSTGNGVSLLNSTTAAAPTWKSLTNDISGGSPSGIYLTNISSSSIEFYLSNIFVALVQGNTVNAGALTASNSFSSLGTFSAAAGSIPINNLASSSTTIAGTANQITSTGGSPVALGGTATLSLPSTLIAPGTLGVTGLSSLTSVTNNGYYAGKVSTIFPDANKTNWLVDLSVADNFNILMTNNIWLIFTNVTQGRSGWINLITNNSSFTFLYPTSATSHILTNQDITKFTNQMHYTYSSDYWGTNVLVAPAAGFQ